MESPNQTVRGHLAYLFRRTIRRMIEVGYSRHQLQRILAEEFDKYEK